MHALTCGQSPVKAVITHNAQYTTLTIDEPGLALSCQPGQFFELRSFSPETQPKKLFKPISIAKVCGSEISFMIKNIGAGTALLCKMRPGDILEYYGPLGTAFPILPDSRAILVSGGVGYPPLAYLKSLLSASNTVLHLHGATTEDDVFPADEIWRMSLGTPRSGYVTQGLKQHLSESGADVVYTCGPIPMLKAVASLCAEYGVQCYASMEAYMACGIGVCHGCVIPVGSPEDWDYLRVCKEGAVFDASLIRWESL